MKRLFAISVLALVSCGPSVPPPVDVADAPPPARPAPVPTAAPEEPSPRGPPPPEPPRPPPGPHTPPAVLLFQEGRVLYEAGDYARACAKFEQSHALDPAIGTAFNVAACKEKQGDKAGACRWYRDAAYRAGAAGQAARAQVASSKASALGCP